MMLQALALCSFVSVSADPAPIASRVSGVTVYGCSALVVRTAALPDANGSYLLQGLPWSLDPDSVRVRADGADVVQIELRERHMPGVPDERVEALRTRLRALEREQQASADEKTVLEQVAAHLVKLLAVDEQEHDRDVGQGRANPDAWAANLKFLASELAGTRTQLRENGWKLEDLGARIEDVRRELGAASGGPGVDLRDLQIDVVGQAGARASLEIEYTVGNAGWRPLYDLRAAKDARHVDLSYRAQVWQQSGEDWSEVELALSTAEPRRGAQGPDPRPIWLSVFDPRVAHKAIGDLVAMERGAPQLRALGYDGGEANVPATPGQAPRPFAAVEDLGLSARFRLARRETIQSRPQPTTVLVGQAQLEATPEYFATPSLDTSVWLRGRTKNTSEWTLLPGRAAVYFGTDFIGHAALAAVQPGEEFTLHLGADPALSVERIQKEDLHEGPGMFGSTATHTESWLVRVENHGAAAAAADGSAQIWMREALPRSTDERLEVELVRASVQPSKAERWKQDLDEQGIRTWSLSVPASGSAELAYTTRVSFPEGMQVASR